MANGRNRIRLGTTEDGTTVGFSENGNCGELRPLQEGKPINGAVVKVSKDADVDGWREWETVYDPDGVGPGRSGPAQVATDSYRTGYDRIFGGNRKAAEA